MTSPRRGRSLAFGLAVGLLAAAFAGIAAPRAARAGWWDDLDKGDPVRLQDLVAKPRDYQGKRVTFACVYRWLDKVFAPYFTTFTPDKYANFSVWADGQPVWEREAYADDFPFLYLPRGHAQSEELTGLSRFARIEVTGKVREVYRDKPWIEVLGFRVTPAKLGEAAVLALKSGDRWAAEGDYVKAEAYYRRALDDVELAEPYKLRVKKRISDVLRAAGRPAEAKAAGGEVLGATPAPVPATTGAQGNASGANRGADEPVPGRWVADDGSGKPRPAAGSPPPAAPEATGTWAPEKPNDAAKPAPGSSHLSRDLPGDDVDAAPKAPAPPTSAPPRSTPTIAPFLPGQSVVAKASDAREQTVLVRENPEADAAWIAKWPCGVIARVVAVSGPWVRARLSDGSIGWVAAKDLEVGDEATAHPSEASPMPVAGSTGGGTSVPGSAQPAGPPPRTPRLSGVK
jgi:hypothetical protein